MILLKLATFKSKRKNVVCPLLTINIYDGDNISMVMKDGSVESVVEEFKAYYPGCLEAR